MQKHYLEDLITPVVEGQGYELVRVLTMGGETHPTLQVMIDTLNGKNITVDDCAKVSRALSDVLDEKDPIKEKYSLEVSSPGLDRPLTKLAHFEKYAGYDVKLETEEKIDNRKRFKGKISKVVGQDIVLTDEKAEYIIPFTAINKAKLVVTDELWERYQASQEEAGEI
ncbi:MAG: ribosome maturation factor RimP [Alphaproteobacteria bacterium]|nr:ribosome maturation factor RimP [Alphaproteobacteria bacterium]